MAYNNKRYKKFANYVVSVYEAYKFADIPDSQIVRIHFPKHNIFISYRQWMNIKAMPLTREERVPITPII